MTPEEILNPENLKSLGFHNVGKGGDRYYGYTWQYKDFRNIHIIDFMGYRNLELEFVPCDIIPKDEVHKRTGDAYTQYSILRFDGSKVAINSNEQIIEICERWAKAIKEIGIEKSKQLLEFYENLQI